MFSLELIFVNFPWFCILPKICNVSGQLVNPIESINWRFLWYLCIVRSCTIQDVLNLDCQSTHLSLPYKTKSFFSVHLLQYTAIQTCHGFIYNMWCCILVPQHSPLHVKGKSLNMPVSSAPWPQVEGHTNEAHTLLKLRLLLWQGRGVLLITYYHAKHFRGELTQKTSEWEPILLYSMLDGPKALHSVWQTLLFSTNAWLVIKMSTSAVKAYYLAMQLLSKSWVRSVCLYLYCVAFANNNFKLTLGSCVKLA